MLVAITLSVNAFAKQSGSKYYVDGFYNSTLQATSLRQSYTGANYSCGPTSLLFIKNYHWRKQFNFKPQFAYDPTSALQELQRMYQDLPVGYNQVTTTTQLKNYVLDEWYGWTAVKADGNDSIATNLGYLKNKLKQDYPAIIALEPSYYGNPIPGYAHIVIIYEYDTNSQEITYFDPYYGGKHTIGVSNISSAIQGNLPYLRIAP